MMKHCRRYPHHPVSIGLIGLLFILGFIDVRAQEGNRNTGYVADDIGQTPSGSGAAVTDEDRENIVIDRMNEIFGRQWSFKILYHKLLEDAAVVLGEITAEGVTKQQFGTAPVKQAGEGDGVGSRASSIGEALKAATTDAFRKAAALFGITSDPLPVGESALAENMSPPRSVSADHDLPVDDIPDMTAETLPGSPLPAPAKAIPDDWFDPAKTRYVGTSMDPEVIDAQSINFSDYNLEAVRITQAPKLDGYLDDPIWQQASAAYGFRQLSPAVGYLDTERSEVRVLYDESNLYLGIMCYDREPEKVVATEMRRDINVDDDDSFDIAIAPYGDNGDSYYFITNPLGSRRDALISPGGGFSGFNPDWDGIWRCYGKRHHMGWSLEIAIPFKTFRFNPKAKQDWAINFGRHVKRTRADAFWVPVSRTEGFLGMYRYATGGRLVGLEGIKPGRAMEILPYTVLGTLGGRQFGGGSEKITYDPKYDFGGNIKWGITSGITADVTVNPDFTQISADRQVVNLSRFEFRFDERRPFFLEGAGIFQFGGRSTGPRIFFSRRIGTQLGDGSTTRILHGEKISGKIGTTTNFGILNVHTEETPWVATSTNVITVQDTTFLPGGGFQTNPRDTLLVTRSPRFEPETSWNVFRLKQNLFGRSFIGVMGTLKEPEDVPDGKIKLPGIRLSDSNYNRVFGVDAVIQPSNSQHVLELIAARSWLPKAELHSRVVQAPGDTTLLNQSGLQWAGTARHSWQHAFGKTLINTSASYSDTRAGFHSDMGFVTRRDIRTVSAGLGAEYLLRKWGIREISAGGFSGGLIDVTWTTGHQGGLFDSGLVQSWTVGSSPGLELENGTYLGGWWERNFDRLGGVANIAGVLFPAGNYTFDTFGGYIETDRGRRIALEANTQVGNFYSGKVLNLSSTVTWKPTYRTLIELDMTYNRLKRTQQNLLDVAYYDERLIPRLRLNYSFSTDMFVSAFVQMNTGRSDPSASWHAGAVTSNLLFGYNMQQGHAFYLAYNAFADDAFDLRGRRPLRPASQTVVAKFSYLLNM